ncbi:hypothetical protein HQO26_17415 [Rhodococcus fascians]|nr:hypothetical protein [Rhodococcus fascians]MBY4418798.1 hypothetical protein [Rhodococcus fascians]
MVEQAESSNGAGASTGHTYEERPPTHQPRVKAQKFTKEQQEKRARQQQYSAEVLKGWKKRREDRRNALLVRENAVRAATKEYQKLDRHELEDIRIRTPFVRLEQKRPQRIPGQQYVRDDDLNTRPPATRLINRKNSALRLLMSAIYVAHLEAEPGKVYTNKRPNVFAEQEFAPWWKLCGQHVAASVGRTNREHGRALNRALSLLRDLEIVEAGPGTVAGRYKNWILKSEDRSGHRYRVPAERRSQETVRVPREFFARGWHLVLEPGEIATFLAIIELTQRLTVKTRSSSKDVGVALGEKVRWEQYGLSEDTYLEAIHALEEFGLIDVVDPMPNRRRGKVSPSENINPVEEGQSDEQIPYRVVFPAASVKTRYAADAVDVVLSRLAYPVPFWLEDLPVDDRVYARVFGK